MSFPPGHGRLKFGEPLLFNDDGTISSVKGNGEIVTIGSAESPVQIRRPQPIGKFDEEPVKIPLGHPLAASTPKANKEKKEANGVDKKRVIQKQRKYLRLLTEHLKKQTAATKETINNGEQTILARKELNRDRIQKAEQDVKEVEQRIQTESKDTQKFKKLCNNTLEQCTHTSKAVFAISNKVDKVEPFEKKHEKAAVNIRMNLNAILDVGDIMKNIDWMSAQMRESQVVDEMEDIQDSLSLSLCLLSVQDSLKTIKTLAPNLFGVNPVGQLFEDTVTRICYVESELVKQFPDVLKEAVSTASTVSTSLVSCGSFCGHLQKTSDVATASTQPSRLIRIDSWPSASSHSASIITDASIYFGTKSPLNESDELLAAGSQDSLVSVSE